MEEQLQSFDPRKNMIRNDFEIFHYRDRIFEEKEVHHHDFYELYFLLGGKVSYLIEGQIYHLEPGDLMLINPMVLHRPVLEVQYPVYERIVLWIDKAYLESCSDSGVSLARCFEGAFEAHTNLLRPTSTQRTELIDCLKELVRESYGNEYGNTVYAKGLLLQFMVKLNRLVINSGFRGEEEGNTLVSQVMEYIGEHYNEELSLEGLSQSFFVSKYYLSHKFSSIVGISVYKYITMRRLVAAKQLLFEGVTPGEVSSRCGFKDYTNFFRAFKAEYGMNPREFFSSKDS